MLQNMSNLHRYDEESSSSGHLYGGDPFLKGIMSMALGEGELYLFFRNHKRQIPLNLTSVTSSNHLEALATTRQSISIPQHHTDSIQPFRSQPSSALVPPRHLAETYGRTAPSIQQDQQQPYDHQKYSDTSWTVSPQSLTFAISTRPSGPYDLSNHGRMPTSTLSNDMSRLTTNSQQWQESSAPPTFGSVHPSALGPPGSNWSYGCPSLGPSPFPTSFEDMTAPRSREIAIHHGEEVSIASMSKFSPLAAPFIPFGQDKVEEEEDDVSTQETAGDATQSVMPSSAISTNPTLERSSTEPIISHSLAMSSEPKPKKLIWSTRPLPSDYNLN